MKPNISQNKVILALQKAILDTFDDGKWRELGYLTDTIDIIEGDRRLLRSLHWGDDDYQGCVFKVLSQIIRHSRENLDLVVEFVGLEIWLRENDPVMYGELYGSGEVIPLNSIEKASSILDVVELNHHASRIRKGISEDPAQAIGSAKELLETVLKEILGEHGSKSKDDIPKLLKRVQRQLGLDPKAVKPSYAGANTVKRTLSNLGQIVVGVGEVRNLFGTGHGRSRAPEIDIPHARLIVNAAITIATFLLEIWQARPQK